MATPENRSRISKFQRYRQAQNAKGLRLLRIWVPDPRSPAFEAQIRRQAALLRDAPEETDALGFIDAAMDWPDA